MYYKSISKTLFLRVLSIVSQRLINSNNFSTLKIKITSKKSTRHPAATKNTECVYSINVLASLRTYTPTKQMANVNRKIGFKILELHGYGCCTSSGVMPIVAKFFWTVRKDLIAAILEESEFAIFCCWFKFPTSSIRLR